jgi:outer membrane protein
MKSIKLTALAALVLLLGAVSASAQQPPATSAAAQPLVVPDGKVVVVNTAVFTNQIGELKQKYDQLEVQFKPRSDKIQADQKRLSDMEQDYKVKGPTLAADKAQQMASEIEDLKRRITRDVEDARADLGKSEEALTKPVRDKLFQFLQTYATQRNIVLIINLAGAAQAGVLAYINPSNDITDDFIKEYNKANPVPGSAPAAQPPAAKPTPKPNN